MVRVSIETIKKQALDEHVPIMMDEGIDFLCDYIQKNCVKKILEIGTAVGYSAIRMAHVDDEIEVVTIERDEIRYQQAIQNIHDLGLENRIHVILGDALDVEITDNFDLIFIDAAKSQYIKFFEKYKTLLNPNGTIISDNLSFHGYVENIDTIQSKNLRQMVHKIQNYIDFLKTNSEFKTTFLPLGDGIGISIRYH